MPDLAPAGVLILAAGLLLIGVGWLAIQRSGAQPRMAMRLATARELRVGDLDDLHPLPSHPIRVVGRIRCQAPIVMADGDRLVAVHRDVEVRLTRGGWRRIERLRESRSFELWDHDGSVMIDPAFAAEPLVVIPRVWRGPASTLDESYRPAVERLEGELGPAVAAHAVTRMLSVVERLAVLGEARRGDDGRVALEPPATGFVISALDLSHAMRLLGGPRRGLLIAGAGAIGLGAVVSVAGLVVAAVGTLAGG
jgi:hypothetical protein